MKKVLHVILMSLSLIWAVGCADISPRDNGSPKLQQDINNQNGKIDRIESNQNAIRLELQRLNLLNQENNNSGVQILQGDGALILIFALVTLFVICCYFYKVGNNYQRIAEILAKEINDHNDPHLTKQVLKAAQNTEVEHRVCSLIRHATHQ